MDEELSAALVPVLRELRASCGVSADIRESSLASRWNPTAVMILDPDGFGQAVGVTSGRPYTEQVAELADQVQEWAVEALWRASLPAVWPECPAHPNSHPLKPEIRGDQAIWCCPHTGTMVAPIGGLPSGSGVG
jgi:hypothetical protein